MTEDKYPLDLTRAGQLDYLRFFCDQLVHDVETCPNAKDLMVSTLVAICRILGISPEAIRYIMDLEDGKDVSYMHQVP